MLNYTDYKKHIGLTKEQYEQIYAGLDVPSYDLFFTEPNSDEDYIMNYLSSKLWRLVNLYTIIDKIGIKRRFIMNYAQHRVYAYLLKHPRLIILKSRQQGISTFFLICYLDDSIMIDDLMVGMQSYGLEESQALFERIDTAWENVPEGVKEFLGIDLTVKNSKRFGWTNSSTMRIQSSFRGSTLQRLHVSELGKIANKAPQKARELQTGTLQAIAPGNYAAIESTAEGRYNAFYNMWYKAVNHVGERTQMDFYPVFLSWVDDPDCNSNIPQRATAEDEEYFKTVENELDIELTDSQRWWATAKRRELKDDFHQEYPYSADDAFASAKDGSYYGKLFRQRGHVVDQHIWDPALEVHTSWDLGINDTTEIMFWQIAGAEVRLIDHLHADGEGLEYYVRELSNKPYKYGYHVLPHDVKVRELQTAKSRIMRLKELGIKKTIILPASSVEAGIERVRAMIPQLWVDGLNCGYVLEAFDRYTKEWDDINGMFKNRPKHDQYSNPMDAVRYFAMSNLLRNVPKPNEVGVKPKKKRRRPASGGLAF